MNHHVRVHQLGGLGDAPLCFEQSEHGISSLLDGWAALFWIFCIFNEERGRVGRGEWAGGHIDTRLS